MYLKALIMAGADPSLCNNYGTTVLHLMMKRGQIEMAELCIKTLEEAEKENSQKRITEFVNKRSNSGLTPLMAAADAGQLEAVEWLLDRNADPNISTDSGNNSTFKRFHDFN